MNSYFYNIHLDERKIDLGVLKTLVKRSEQFPYQHKHFYLFAKSGFTKERVDRAKEMENVTLVRYGEIIVRN